MTRILEVDDDPLVRLFARETLEPEGFAVTKAEQGEEALICFASTGGDLILLDVIMPRLGGFAPCERLRQSKSAAQVPILMMTGLDEQASIQSAHDAGATDFIVKPIVWAVLVYRVCYILRASAALQPISQGLLAELGSTGADAGRGLSLRMDQGTQYSADDFLNQVKLWGINPSFAFVAESQTNGVAERFNRTLKEQAIHGRIFKDVEAFRVAVTEHKDRYNRRWRLEKLGFMSPLEARQAYAMQQAACQGAKTRPRRHPRGAGRGSWTTSCL